MTVVHANLDHERAVLGAVLLGPSALPALLADVGLRTEHFYWPTHAHVFAAMVRLYDRSEPVDALTVIAELRAAGAERDGDIDLDAFVHSLPSIVPDAGNHRHYAALVLEDAVWRRRQRVAHDLVAAVDGRDADRVADAEGQLAQADERNTGRTGTPEQLAHRLVERIEHGKVEAWPFPFERLNKLTAGGMRREQVTLIGGWTSHGKTVLLDQTLEGACKHGAGVRLYTNEMSDEDRVLRRISRETGLPFMRLLQGELRDREPHEFLQAIERFTRDGFPIVAAAGMSADDISHDARRHCPDVIGIDILHEIEYTDERDLARISRSINRLARQAHCHVVATVHLNDGRATGAQSPPPVLRDIKGASALRQGADNVLFVWRENDGESIDTTSRAYFAKVRNGMLGGIDLDFEAKRMRFVLPPLSGTAGRQAA